MLLPRFLNSSLRILPFLPGRFGERRKQAMQMKKTRATQSEQEKTILRARLERFTVSLTG